MFARLCHGRVQNCHYDAHGYVTGTYVKWLMQDDNSPCHRSSLTLSFQHINILDWHENSPDANSIENLWHLIKIKMNDLGWNYKAYCTAYLLPYKMDLLITCYEECLL